MPAVGSIDQKRIHLAARAVAELRILLPLHQREVGDRFVCDGHEGTGQSLIVIVCSIHMVIVARVGTSANGGSNTVLENGTCRYSFAQQRKVIRPVKLAVLIKSVRLRQQLDLQIVINVLDVRRAPVFHMSFGTNFQLPIGVLYDLYTVRSSYIDTDLVPCS